MTISYVAYREDENIWSEFHSCGVYTFRVGNTGFSLQPNQCDELAAKAAEHLGCTEPVTLLDLKEDVLPGILPQNRDIMATLVGDTITIIDIAHVGRLDNLCNLHGTKTIISYEVFMRLLQECHDTMQEFDALEDIDIERERI